ncbi:MAG: LysR family transcriptional regulator [Actinobacteria bacterium]|nr:LysR family transcriptional regulator [Actinomycetota bacterium]
MELDLFKSFLAVAEARSFSRAARAIHSTQPTLSRQIARLEAELGAKLFERYGRHVECTVAGRLLQPLAQAIITRTEDAISLMREQAGAGPSAVRFGAVPSVIARILTPVLVTFQGAYPNVNVDITEADDVQLEEGVVRGELDFAVVTLWGSIRASTQYLLTEEILLVMPRTHRLAKLKAIPFGALAGESILLPRASLNISNVYSDALRRAGQEIKFSYRANYPELTKALVRRGFGLAPMPSMLCSPEDLEDLKALPFEEPLYRDLHLIYPRDRPLTTAARALMAHIRASVSRRGRSSHI